MISYLFLRYLPVALATTVLLAGCSESAPPTMEPVANEVAAASPGEAPVSQLDQSVVPGHYRLEIRVDPSQDDFSGVTEIDVTLSEPRDQLWLHGKGLQVSSAWLTDASGNRVEASYEQKLESGVALVSLARVVEAGDATLHF
jgi:alanyl aminopeptidase